MTHTIVSTDWLRMFDEGGAPAGGGESSADGAAEAGAEVGGQSAEATAASEEQVSSEQKPAETRQQRIDRWNKLVTGEFKDIYSSEIQRIINERFRNTRELEERIAAQSPIVEALADRYGVDAGDPKAVLDAIERDGQMWQEAADAAGLTVEQYRQVQRLERDNARLRAEQMRVQGEQQVQRQLAEWQAEADTLKAEYPEFDLAAECRSEPFLRMLRAGVPVAHAYKVTHLSDITARAAADAEKRAAQNVAARGARPSEAGASAATGAVLGTDASKMSKEQRADLAARAARGEKIRL